MLNLNKMVMEDRYHQVVFQIQQLGYCEGIATDMLETFLVKGFLACFRRWPREFTFLSKEYNVLDIMLDNGVRFPESFTAQAWRKINLKKKVFFSGTYPIDLSFKNKKTPG
jgi:hypothetical protein